MTDDYWAISNLIARYAELLNLGKIDEVADLFRYGRITSETNDAVHDGSEAVAAWYRESVRFPDKAPDTLLFTSNLQIEVEGDAASAKAYFVALHQSSGAVTPVIAGRYHDEFRRIDGVWWFHHRHLIPDLIGDTGAHVRASIPDKSGR